jgi:hypothetical protein
MTKTFEIGDHVSWNSEAGRVSGEDHQSAYEGRQLQRLHPPCQRR